MTTIKKINKYKPLSLDEIIQKNEAELQKLESFNAVDIFCYNIIRKFQLKSNYNTSVSNLKYSLHREYLAKYDEEHPIKYLGSHSERFRSLNEQFNDFLNDNN